MYSDYESSYHFSFTMRYHSDKELADSVFSCMGFVGSL